MDRLGIERGEHIDSKIVSRAIENAQKKVENMHFEARKHILKYDDVANEQRKVIYKFRDQILDPNFDIEGKIKEIRKDFVEYILAENEIFPHSLPEEYDYQKLIAHLKEYSGVEFSEEELKDKDYEDLKNYIVEKLEKSFEEKFKDASKEDKERIIRQVMLQVLDESWRDHLYMMDILKTGIGLRGYNQKDPLVEYKKESFALFEELIQRIKIESMKILHNLKIEYRMPEIDPEIEEFIKAIEGKRVEDILNNIPEVPEYIEEKDLDEVINNLEEQTKRLQAEFEAKQAKKRVKRNDPCPCGSGKKYKDCCGKSPKF
jgi:preprotein translocase subunit SecA